jgi:tRNA dimethylallyltransferase
MQAIGYRHIQPVVDGADTLVNALEGIKVDTRRFARRQRTWLRAIPDVHWHDPKDEAGVLERVEGFLACERDVVSADGETDEGRLRHERV